MKSQDLENPIEWEDLEEYLDKVYPKPKWYKKLYWDVKRWINARLRKWRVKNFTKKCMFLYPFYDYSCLFELISLWATEASKMYKESNLLVSSPRTSKELLIVSELCNRIADNFNEENERDYWGKKYGGYENFSNDVWDRMHKRVNERDRQDIEYLCNLIIRKYRFWWE